MRVNNLEKVWKAVPDVESLKYHGTPKKPDIKIFVSHRIDQDSVTIDNPPYIPVRCGAVYDEREGVTMLGDDTGDNISERRESFCELTVLYWAWKNIKADYYGLCHYRRYISFANKSFIPKNNHSGFLVHPTLDNEAVQKFRLNEKSIQELATQYDFITTPSEDVLYSFDGKHHSVYGLCQNRRRDFDMEGVNSLISIIKDKFPQYSKATDEYFAGHYAKYYNCFLIQEKLFHEMCTFIFGVLFELEKKLDTQHYNKWQTRMPGFMGENLVGIYYLHLANQKQFKLKELDLVYFQNTAKANTLKPAFQENNIPIVFSASNLFAPYAAVMIKSILEHISPQNNYDFIVFENTISKERKDLLRNMIDSYSNVSLRFYDPKPLLQNIKFYVNSSMQSEEAYYRILAPFVLSEYEKAIVMDCDIIAKCDIAELYYVDLDGKLAGIVPDVVWHGGYMGLSRQNESESRKNVDLKNPLEYVNTGVILFDLKKMRQTYTKDEVVSFATRKKYLIQEQDALNELLEGQIKFLPLAWNLYALTNDSIKTMINEYAPTWEKELYYEAHQYPKLIHWAAQPKPWIQPDMDYAEEFWAVAKRTPFYEIIMWQMITLSLGQLHPAVYDLQCRMGLFDTRSGARKLADKLLPKNSKRREFAKFLLPKGSLRWRFCKQIYYIFKPKYRPAK